MNCVTSCSRLISTMGFSDRTVYTLGATTTAVRNQHPPLLNYTAQGTGDDHTHTLSLTDASRSHFGMGGSDPRHAQNVQQPLQQRFLSWWHFHHNGRQLAYLSRAHKRTWSDWGRYNKETRHVPLQTHSQQSVIPPKNPEHSEHILETKSDQRATASVNTQSNIHGN